MDLERGARPGLLGRLGQPAVAALVTLGLLGAFTAGWEMVDAVEALDTEECVDGTGGYGCRGDATIAVDPSTELVDRQTVRLTGSGFDPGTDFGVAQCAPDFEVGDGPELCDLSTGQLLPDTSSEGTVDVDVVVRRIIVVQGDEIDCAVAACTISGATLDGLTPIEAAAADISFDPSVPPIPDLEVAVEVDDVSTTSAAGTVTCNREALAAVDLSVQQTTGRHFATAYGYTAEIDCGPTASPWSIDLVEGTGVLRGGPADWFAYAYAYDDFESASAGAQGSARLTGGATGKPEPSSTPGEDVTIDIVGTSSDDGELSVDVLVECDRSAAQSFVYVSVSQTVGLARVGGSGFLDLGVCDGSVDASVPITSIDGVLSGGRARADATVDVYDGTTGYVDHASATDSVRLRGQVSGPTPVVTPDPESRITIDGASRDEVRGSVDCDTPADVYLSANAEKRSGRTTDRAFGWIEIECDGSTDFRIPLQDPFQGGGSASVWVYGEALRVTGEPTAPTYEFLWFDQQSANVKIRG